MGFVHGVHRRQLLMLAQALDGYTGDDNPVRCIHAFVDNLDLQASGFERAVPRQTGRPPYHPGTRNVEQTSLLAKLAPDFETIADFRGDNSQAAQPGSQRHVRRLR